MENEILDKIKQADLILVGVGEEFNNLRRLREKEGYNEVRELLMASDKAWMVPAWNDFSEDAESEVYESLCKLAELLKNKNYFVVSVVTNKQVERVPWKEGRLVMPCGSALKKQCVKGCENVLADVTVQNMDSIANYFSKLAEKGTDMQELPAWKEEILGRCSECGAPLVFNSIYADNYNENGYRKQWEIYRKWLQGTLNKNLLLLELGVGMQFPSVIRWPFEKIAFFNEKAKFYRVNEKLYQLSEELGKKGISIAENAIDWLKLL